MAEESGGVAAARLTSFDTAEVGARFWKYVEISSDPNGCWTWRSWCDRKGYGRVSVNRCSRLAHRIVMDLVGRPIPPGMLACHKCDNPSCVNPDHIEVGTNSKNITDAYNRGALRAYVGRGNGKTRGSSHANSKLNETAVRKIRTLASYGMTHAALSEVFRVSRATIARAISGESWAHVTVPQAALGMA